LPDTKLSEKEFLNLKNQIIMAEKVNETKLLPQATEAIRRYTSNFIPDNAHDWDIVLNEIYPIIQQELATIYFRNPRVFLKPKNKFYSCMVMNPATGKKEEVFMESAKSAKTQEAILNYTLGEIGYETEITRILFDALLFKHGVLWHGYKGDFGMTEEQSLTIKKESVFVKRISPMQFIFDPSVTLANLDEAQWIGRWFMVPLEDLLEDDKLDIDKKSITGQEGYGLSVQNGTERGNDVKQQAKRVNTLLDMTDSDFRKSSLCRFVKVYEIFKRPTKKEMRDGEMGKLVLYTPEQNKAMRVSKWPYKAEGWPAEILQFNELVDSMFGMSDLDVYGKIADQKNQVINLQLRNAQENSKLWVAIAKDGANEEDIEKVRVGDQTIVLFNGDTVQGKMTVASGAGAASSELYTLDQRIQQNLDEKVGIPDLKKGSLRTGEESATSVQARMQGTSLRPAYRQNIMAKFVKKSVHFINQLNKQFMPIKEAVRIMGTLDVQWSQNPSKEEVQADTDVDIDVISMLPENPAQELQENMQILNLAVSGIQNPAIGQKLEQEGYIFNLSPILQNILYRLKIRDPEVLRQIRPDESQGFVKVAEIRAAKQNVEAALAGQEPPSPPQEGQDHKARLETYGSIHSLLEGLGDSIAKQLLEQLIMAQQALLQAEQEKENPQAMQKLPFKNPKTIEI